MLKKIMLTAAMVAPFVTASYSQIRMFTIDQQSRYELYFVNVDMWENEADWLKEKERVENANLKFIQNLDTLRGFLIDNQEAILNLSNQWVGDSTRNFYFCWYHYFVYVVKDGKIVDELRVNMECKQVVSWHGLFIYKDFPFENLDRSKKISVVDVDYATTPQSFTDRMKQAGSYSVKMYDHGYSMRYFSKHSDEVNKLVKEYTQHKP